MTSPYLDTIASELPTTLFAHDQPEPDAHTLFVAERSTGVKVWEGTIRKHEDGYYEVVSTWSGSPNGPNSPMIQYPAFDQRPRDLDAARRWLRARLVDLVAPFKK